MDGYTLGMVIGAGLVFVIPWLVSHLGPGRTLNTVDALKAFCHAQFWTRPLRLLVAAVILIPSGPFASPVLAGRAAQVYAQRTGRRHPLRLGVAFGILWFLVIYGTLFVWLSSLDPGVL